MIWEIEKTEVLEYKKEIAGLWWFANDPDKKIPGKLTFTYRDGIFLELDGNFNLNIASNSLGIIILGESSFGELITIYQAFIIDSSAPGFSSGKGQSKFYSNKGFIGHHFKKKEEIVFRNIDFYLTNFEDWLNLKIFDFSEEYSSYSIKYRYPKSFKYHIGEENMTFSFFSSISTIQQKFF